MNIIRTTLNGVLLIEPRVFGDARGFVFESYRLDQYGAAGIPRFVQDNHSRSVAGTLRGLHFQSRHPQAKLIRVVRGSIVDVMVDIRKGSPTFGRWETQCLSEENKRQLFIPEGFAHGFYVPDQLTEVEYKCSDYYDAEDQHGIIWNDRVLGIEWPVEAPILSTKDAALGAFAADREDFPVFAEHR